MPQGAPRLGEGVTRSLNVIMAISQGLPSGFISKNTGVLTSSLSPVSVFLLLQHSRRERVLSAPKSPTSFLLCSPGGPHKSLCLGFCPVGPPTCSPMPHSLLKTVSQPCVAPRPDSGSSPSLTVPPLAPLPHQALDTSHLGPPRSFPNPPHFPRASSTRQPFLTTTPNYISCSSQPCSPHCQGPLLHSHLVTETFQVCVLFSQQMTQHLTSMLMLPKTSRVSACSVQGTDSFSFTERSSGEY